VKDERQKVCKYVLRRLLTTAQICQDLPPEPPKPKMAKKRQPRIPNGGVERMSDHLLDGLG